jgi:hypothetical protein
MNGNIPHSSKNDRSPQELGLYLKRPRETLNRFVNVREVSNEAAWGLSPTIAPNPMSMSAY